MIGLAGRGAVKRYLIQPERVVRAKCQKRWCPSWALKKGLDGEGISGGDIMGKARRWWEHVVHWGICKLYTWKMFRDDTREANRSHSRTLGLCRVWEAQQVMKPNKYFKLSAHSFSNCSQNACYVPGIVLFLGCDIVVIEGNLSVLAWSLLPTV